MLPYSTQLIEEDDIAAVVEILRSSHLTQGAKVEEFESTLASYVGVKHCITFNSATSALMAAYSAAGITVADEIDGSAILVVLIRGADLVIADDADIDVELGELLRKGLELLEYVIETGGGVTVAGGNDK